MVASSKLWSCVEPTSWPASPEEMTVSTLRAIEACPRRWALQSASYPHLWTRLGYPPRAAVRALIGTIVHAVAERISKALVQAGCGSLGDPRSVEVMRSLGGYTKLISEVVDQSISRCHENPRITKTVDRLETTLRGKTGEIRNQAHKLLLNLKPTFAPSPAGSRTGGAKRGPLGPGLYAEITIRARSIGWKGKPDLLGLGQLGCEIVEFKTGERREEHAFQVTVYGALWAADEELNPSRSLPIRLTLAYTDGNDEIPVPTRDQIGALLEDLRNRRNAARAEVDTDPPVAKPSAENCSFCDVRHLCQPYWKSSIPDRADAATRKSSDIQLRIEGRHGPTSWDAVVELSHDLSSQTSVLVRFPTLEHEFQRGDRIRLIDAWLSSEDDPTLDKAPTTIIAAGPQTEVFRVVA